MAKPWDHGVSSNCKSLVSTTASCRPAGHQLPYWNTIGMGPTRDLRATTSQGVAAFTFYHPAMQEVVLGAAREVGAEIWRGTSVLKVNPGEPPTISVERAGAL